MPVVSRFFGIVIKMYTREHGVPHFHALYGDHTLVMGIEPQTALAGWLPGPQRSRVEEWAALHRAELLTNWQRAVSGTPPLPIRGLE